MWKILVVEDDPMLGQIYKDYIKSQTSFVCVDIAKDTKSAYAAIEKYQPDLMLLDVYLPEMTGIDFLIELRNKGNYLDVILITASKEFKKIEKAFHYGAIDYLIKPFEFERLGKSLDVFIQRKKMSETSLEIDQSKVDDFFACQSYDEEKEKPCLPKGLNERTLLRVKTVLNEIIEAVTIDVIAKRADLSKVALRKYLVYLEDLNEIKVEMAYGTRGRPSYLYQKKSNHS